MANNLSIEYTRLFGDIDNIFEEEITVGQDINPYFNPHNYSRTAFRSFLPKSRPHITSCRSSGSIPRLAKHNYELERPIQFSNDIRVAFLQYKALLEKSRQLAIDEITENSLSYTFQLRQYEKQQAQMEQEKENRFLEKKTIPEAESISKLADDVSQRVIAQAYPTAASQIRYLSQNEPNMDIVKYLEEGFATRDLTEDGKIDHNSDLWKQFLDVYEDAKMIEGIQYVQDLTGEDLSTILDDYANDFYDLQLVTHHKDEQRQYHIEIPPQWASSEVKAAAFWISRNKLLQSGDLPELIPYNSRLDDMRDLNALYSDQQDEMLTQTSILAASTTTNHLDLVKDSTIIDTLTPYIQFEQNTLNMIETANAIVFKNIFDRQSMLMEQLRTFKPSLQAEIDVLRDFDRDALDRFNTMHLMHRDLLHAFARGTASRAQMFGQMRDNVIDMYLKWVQEDHSDEEEKTQGYVVGRMAAEKKIEGEVAKMKKESYNIMSRDLNTANARDSYLESTQNERSLQLEGLYGVLLKTKEKMAKVIDDEFTKLDMLMSEIDLADKEFALYVDKIEVHKREWDRYSLLTKAAVIKAMVLQQEGNVEEADELLDSTNKGVLNMEYLKKVNHVIAAEIEKVANVAGRRVHNAYCQFDPTLSQYQARNDRMDMAYPIPEPFILSPNIIIPEDRQYYTSSSSIDTSDIVPGGGHGAGSIEDMGGYGFNDDNMNVMGSGRNTDQQGLNPYYNPTATSSQSQLGPQSFSQLAYQSDPLAPMLNPNIPTLPEDFELLETTSFERRTPTINPETGVGAWEGAFKKFMGTSSAYAAGLETDDGAAFQNGDDGFLHKLDLFSTFQETKFDFFSNFQEIKFDFFSNFRSFFSSNSFSSSPLNEEHDDSLHNDIPSQAQHHQSQQQEHQSQQPKQEHQEYQKHQQQQHQKQQHQKHPQFPSLPDLQLTRMTNGFALLKRNPEGLINNDNNTRFNNNTNINNNNNNNKNINNNNNSNINDFNNNNTHLNTNSTNTSSNTRSHLDSLSITTTTASIKEFFIEMILGTSGV